MRVAIGVGKESQGFQKHVMDSLRLYWTFARPFTLLPPVVGILCGSLISAAATHTSFPVLRVTLSMIGVAVLNGASNGLNQIYDLASDSINKPHRPLPSAGLSLRRAWTFVIAAYLMALAMACVVGGQTFVLYALAAVATIAYSVPPLRLKRHPFAANFIIALVRGKLLIVAGWSVVATVLRSIEPWYLGFILFLFLLGAATTKDFADIEGDRATGCITLPVRYGVERSARVISPAFVLPWLLLPLGVRLKILNANWPAILILTLVMVVWGGYVAYRMNHTAQSLANGSWHHMYWMLMLGDVGLATAYLIR